MKQLLSYLLFFASCVGLCAQPQMGRTPQISPDELDTLLKSMTEDDINQIMQELSKLSPQELEELEKEGRRILIESGIDPDTGKSLGAEQTPQAAEPAVAAPVAVAAPIVTRELVASPAEIARLLTALQNHLSDLRQKALYHDALSRRLIQWAEVLQDLVFYTKVINKPEHHERLATKDFQQLLKNLSTLYAALKEHEPLIIVDQELATQDDPYELLRVHHDATQQEIEAQYARLKELYNTKKLKRRMVKEGATQKDIAREVKAAELTFSLVKDAYEQISDAQARASFDKKRATQQADITAAVQAHVNALLETLSTLVYQQGLLDALQDFLKKYEPEQLAHKQALEAANAQRKKEQEEAEKRKALPTQGSFDKRHKGAQPLSPVPYAGGGGSYYPADYGYSPYASSYSQPYSSGFSPDDAKEKKAAQTGGGAGSKSGGKPPKTDEEKLEDARKALEKQEIERIKKESAKYKKELEDLKNAPTVPTPPPAKERGAPPLNVQPVPPANTVQSGIQLIDSFEELCQDMAAALKSDSVRSLAGLTRAGRRVSAEQCQQLIDELQLVPCLNQLKRITTLCDNATQEQLSAMKPAWQKLTDTYGRTFKSVIDQTKKESGKYTLEESDVTPEYVCKARSIVGDITTRINIISGLFSMDFKLLVEEPEAKKEEAQTDGQQEEGLELGDDPDTATA